MKSRLAGLVTGVALMLALSACMAGPTSTPRPTPTPIDPGTLIGQMISPVGTTWTGTDSAGDPTTFTLKADQTVRVTYGANTFDETGDSWAVKAGVLELRVYINTANGQIDYRATYDPATKALAATGTASASGKIVTVALTQK